MLPTTSLRAAVARVPMIRFIGKRAPSGPHAPHPHPQAPKEIAEAFAEFLAKSQAAPAGGAAASSAAGQYIPLYKANQKSADFESWNMPEELFRRPEMSEREMEAVMSGGATDIRTGP